MLADTTTEPLSVYVHVPWCVRKCPYCDFATKPGTPETIPHQAFGQSLATELDLRWPEGHGLASVYFGGGTPSLWDPAELGAFVRRLDERRPATRAGSSAREHALRASTAPNASARRELEVTVECNPSELTLCLALKLRDAGATRLSIGVQSFSDKALGFLGRRHSAAQAEAGVNAARGAGLRISTDHIYGLPGESVEDALATTKRLLELGTNHVSAYALTIERDTRFGELARQGRLPTIDEGVVADTYLAIEAALDAAGFTHYEVSNYGRGADRADHNSRVWRQESYLGLGPGAVGTLYTPGWAHTAAVSPNNTSGRPTTSADGADAIGPHVVEPSQHRADAPSDVPPPAHRWRNDGSVTGYLSALGARRLPSADTESMTHADIGLEALILGLRTREGAAIAHLTPELRHRAHRLHAAGRLEQTPTHYRVPRQAWLHLDALLRAL